MSLAIRKRSWEEHVTRWMGLPFSSIEYNTACRHGLVADNFQASMEKDEGFSVDRKEKCASLPDCCHGGELICFPEKLLSNISKEVDENDNHEDEEHFLSLEASTETLVHVSGDDDDDISDLGLDKVNHHFTTIGRKLTDEEKNLGGAGSLTKMVAMMKTHREPNISETIGDIDEPDYDTVPKEEKEEENICGSIGKSLELYNYKGLNELIDDPRKNLSNSLNLKEIMPEKQLLHTAVIAQQRRKSDAPKDGHEKASCIVVQDEFSAGVCTGSGKQPFLKTDSSNYLVQSPLSYHITSMEDGLDESPFTEPQAVPQNMSLTNVTPVQGMNCLNLQDNLTTHESTDNQVKLRKRKEMREDRDRSRLDSMVLLIMKLDQLDQDIENALSTGSSPSSTPTNKRRHIPVSLTLISLSLTDCTFL
uniref:Rho GTPase-activating protein 7 n=1 Tax=Pelusios castaneus TaxID=367368 RepID=A0A8C8VGW5_9SAUR